VKAKPKKVKRKSSTIYGVGGLADSREAIALHRSGKLKEAEHLYQAILKADPDHVETQHFLGVLYHQCGQSDRAIASIERAIQMAPDYADAHNNLGNVLMAMNQLEPALRSYVRAVELVPDYADAWNNLGVVLRGLGQYDEAERAYAHAISLNPRLVAAWQNHGNLLARKNRLDEAIAAYSQVLNLKPNDSAAYDALGRALYRSSKVEQAIGVYQRWLQAEPANSVARHMLSACIGDNSPVRASDDYVRNIFDIFAGSFDQVLDQLGYRAPQLISELLEKELPPADGTLVIADAGCGTGLCADFLKPRAKQLVGVDLSPGMLTKARARKKYDELVEAELTSWFADQHSVYDLIVSADTLCYFGALESVLMNAQEAMRRSGLMAFTVEMAGDGVPTYQLNPSGRYSHAEGYVRDCLSCAGLNLLSIEQVELRRELGQLVIGFLVSAAKPDASTNQTH
jgi:predicted TPR repeat methyltransferase